MHKDYPYASVFASMIKDYIASHREVGFMYDNQAYWLFRFDRYCCDNEVKEVAISKQLFEAWAAKSDTETKTTQNNRLQALKGFCVYLNIMGIPAYIPLILPRPEKVVPYLMKDEDIQEFFEQVDLYTTTDHVPAFQRMAHEYKVLFRLIYCCGLRNNEACSLKIKNIDTVNGILTLYQSKGRKDRIVYLSEDLRRLCLSYLQWLNVRLDAPSEWLFPGKNPEQHIPKTSLDRKFNELWNRTRLSKTCDKKPTVHCLRHAFVIKRINSWMEADIPLNVMMPYLSSYLGHKGPMETYYYFHQVEDAFRTVRRKDGVSALVIPEVQYES